MRPVPKPPGVSRPVFPLLTGWRLSKHARDRAAEFGYSFGEVVRCADAPDLSYTQTDYGPGDAVHKRGDIAVVVNTDSRVVVTVLLPLVDDWSHGQHTRTAVSPPKPLEQPDPTPCTPEPRKPVRRAARPQGAAVQAERMSGLLRESLRLSKDADTAAARRYWAERANALLAERRKPPSR